MARQPTRRLPNSRPRPPRATRTGTGPTGFEGLELARELLPAFRPRVLPRRPHDAGVFRLGHSQPRRARPARCRGTLGALAPATASRAGTDPPRGNEDVTGFVFKVQANMDKNHRDRVAFVRLSSGVFKRGMKLRNVKRGKDITVTSPMFFFARERETADEAFPGDVVGIPNHGALSVGDTLSEGRNVAGDGHSRFRSRNHPPRHPSRPDQGQAIVQGADRPQRGGRDPGVPAYHRFGLDRRCRRQSAARRFDIAGRQRIRRADPVRKLRHRDGALARL